MKTFQVYKHPTLGAQAVKVGFCWPAIFFGLFWMMASRLWSWVGLWMVFYTVAVIILMAASATTNESLQIIAGLAFFGGCNTLYCACDGR